MITFSKGDPTPFTDYIVMDDGSYRENDMVRICSVKNIYVCSMQLQAYYVKNKLFLLEVPNMSEPIKEYDPKTFAVKVSKVTAEDLKIVIDPKDVKETKAVAHD